MDHSHQHKYQHDVPKQLIPTHQEIKQGKTRQQVVQVVSSSSSNLQFKRSKRSTILQVASQSKNKSKNNSMQQLILSILLLTISTIIYHSSTCHSFMIDKRIMGTNLASSIISSKRSSDIYTDFDHSSSFFVLKMSNKMDDANDNNNDDEQRKGKDLSSSSPSSDDKDGDNKDDQNNSEKMNQYSDFNSNSNIKSQKQQQPCNGKEKIKDINEKDANHEELVHRITQLEALAGSQAVELRKLREECNSLKDAALAFNQVVELLRQAGLSVQQDQPPSSSKIDSSQSNSSNNKSSEGDTSPSPSAAANAKEGRASATDDGKKNREYEYIDEAEIFGTAPASVTDAADAAGASILAAILGGKQRMLVDVRDAELSRDPDVLVQFIELAILPVAAGLEGLKTRKNRVKIVLPTVSQLLEYRKTMTLSAPEVIALSTLGFDPVEERDNLVVIIAPSPDDDEGLEQMNTLLASESLLQPVVVLNHHMVPLSGPGGEYSPVYHLRLLTVQYMAGGEAGLKSSSKQLKDESNAESSLSQGNFTRSGNSTSVGNALSHETEDAALAAAMEHAHELGIHQGVTRAMVIRAYPKPWHVFVDTSPDTDADFEVAATFDEYPSQDDINYAIVECLEGSEREDQLVAQQMQEAIESGQLNSISDMLGLSSEEEEEDDDDDFSDWDPWFGADTV